MKLSERFFDTITDYSRALLNSWTFPEKQWKAVLSMYQDIILLERQAEKELLWRELWGLLCDPALRYNSPQQKRITYLCTKLGIER